MDAFPVLTQIMTLVFEGKKVFKRKKDQRKNTQNRSKKVLQVVIRARSKRRFAILGQDMSENVDRAYGINADIFRFKLSGTYATIMRHYFMFKPLQISKIVMFSNFRYLPSKFIGRIRVTKVLNKAGARLNTWI